MLLLQINIGIMHIDSHGEKKPRRGTTLPLEILNNVNKEELLESGTEKLKAFSGTTIPPGPYNLMYASGEVVDVIPLTNEPFRLDLYKIAIGKTYARITFYLLPLDELDCMTYYFIFYYYKLQMFS